MRISVLSSAIVTVICSVFVVLAAARMPSVKVAPWVAAEKETIHARYTEHELDSIKKYCRISSQDQLRHLTLNQPFLKREKLVYDIGWEFFRGGYGIIESQIFPEQNRLTVTSRIVSNDVLSGLFRVRDLVATDCDLAGMYPTFFEQHLNERGNLGGKPYVNNGWTLYDHSTGHVFSDGFATQTSRAITPFAQNYLSLFPSLRTRRLAPGDTFSIHCYVHDKDYPMFFRCQKRESVKVPAGKFICIRVQPTLVGTGRGFTAKDRMWIWLTDDAVHMPVRMSSVVAIGSITVELQAWERE